MSNATREITGATRVLFILADPVAHVRTPQAMNALAATRGSDTVLVPCEVSVDSLGQVLAAIRRMKNVGGAVVTVPHKIAAAALCDELSTQASLVGAVNVIRNDAGRLYGEIFDGRGFVASLVANGIPVGGEQVFMVGAGGAARAIGFALAEAGASRLVIHNRTRTKAAQLAQRIHAEFPDTDVVTGGADPGGASLVVNASSLGMRADDPAPFDLRCLDEAMTVADVIMHPEETALLQAARHRGCRVQTGRPMLEHQLRLIADFLQVGQAASLRGGVSFP